MNELSAEEVNKLSSNYKTKLSGQIVQSLGKSIIRMYSKRACAVLGMSDRDTLSKDLKSDPFLDSALEVHVRTVLQIRFISCTPKCWTDYEQALLV